MRWAVAAAESLKSVVVLHAPATTRSVGHAARYRSITEQTWGIMRNQLTYKAAWAGRELVAVDPKFTSQRCSGCGVVSADHRQRKRYDCVECGMSKDADVNVALNILHKALAGKRWPDIRLPAAS